MTDKPWIEKYRPNIFDDYLSHSLIKNILLNLIDKNNFHNLILYGPPGVGKTTLINICAKYIYGDNYEMNILQLNGSDDRGINIVRDDINKYANTKNMYKNKFKLVILDEIDSMTYDAQCALKEIIEIFDYNTKFCLICNFINKIIYPLQSCCVLLRLPSINNTNIYKYLENICKKENIKFAKTGLDSLIKLSNGDLRKAGNNLQSINLSNNQITKNIVYDSLGIPKDAEILKLIIKLKENNLKKNVDNFISFKNKKGYLLNDLIKITIDIILNLNIDNNILIDIILEIGNLEYNLANLGSEIINTYSFISTLCQYKDYF